MRDKCDAALDGILYVKNEAFLAAGILRSTGDLRLDPVDVMIEFMARHRGRIIVILDARQNQFDYISFHLGLARRFTETIHFAAYDAFELIQILNAKAKRLGLDLPDEIECDLFPWIMANSHRSDWRNADEIADLFSKALGARALRGIAPALRFPRRPRTQRLQTGAGRAANGHVGESRRIRRISTARYRGCGFRDRLQCGPIGRSCLHTPPLRCGTASRRKLAKLAAAANPAPTPKAVTVPRMARRPRHSATSAAPIVWPSSRDVAIMPLAPPARSGGADAISALRLGDWKKPKPAPQSSHAPAYLECARHRRHQREADHADGEHDQTGAAEKPDRIAFRKPAGERRRERDRHGPWRHQKSSLDLTAAEHTLEIERQSDEGGTLAGEGTGRGERREREDRAGEEIERQHRRRQRHLPPDQRKTENQRSRELTNHEAERRLMRRLADRQNEEAECAGIENGAQPIESMRRPSRMRQIHHGEDQSRPRRKAH